MEHDLPKANRIAAEPDDRPRVRSTDRAWRLAYAKTIHDLRRSVAKNRPISLPNLLRLYRRRAAAFSLLADPQAIGRLQQALDQMARYYRERQPFR